MPDFLTARHSFNAGDLVTTLPGLKAICEKEKKQVVIYQRLNLPAEYYKDANHPVTDKGRHVCMNERVFRMLKPLLEHQSYIQGFEIWQGQDVRFDFDKTRMDANLPLPGGDIHYWPVLIYPELSCNTCDPWLKAPYRNYGFELSASRSTCYLDGAILIGRTERYTNPYIHFNFLKKYQSDLIFIGTDREHFLFCEQNQMNIPCLKISDFMVAAQAIRACRFFMGNQSFFWHIADAMKVPRILEVCPQFPNTWPTGGRGAAYAEQVALEYHFNVYEKFYR